MKRIFCVLMLTLCGAATASAATTASDDDLSGVVGMSCNKGKVCSALSGAECTPGAATGGPYADCNTYTWHDNTGPDGACANAPPGANMNCVIPATPPYPKHDTCPQTTVMTNHCELHAGYCVNLQVGTCGAEATVGVGWTCECLAGGATVPDTGTRYYCM